MNKYAVAKSQIALEALHVPVETTFTIDCPICEGGPAKLSRRMSVTRSHNGAMFLCHRASCGFRGFVAIGGSGSKDTPPARKPQPARPYTGALRTSTQIFRAFVLRYRGLDLGYDCFDLFGQHEYAQDGEGNDVFKCRGIRGETLGHVVRSPDKTIRTFRARDGVEMYSYYRGVGAPRSLTIVLVEDCVSAMCIASHGFDSVALLGTNLPESLKQGLLGLNRPLLVILDPDAERKAILLAGDLGARAIIGAPKDPKDLPDLGERLEEYR